MFVLFFPAAWHPQAPPGGQRLVLLMQDMRRVQADFFSQSGGVVCTTVHLLLLFSFSDCLNICLCHRYPSIVKGSSSLPPEDRLLKFLVDNNADAEETVQCANCDQESNKKV